MGDTRHILITVAFFDRDTGESRAIEKDAIISFDYSVDKIVSETKRALEYIEQEY